MSIYMFDNIEIHNSSHILHLGHLVGNYANGADIERSLRDFYGKVSLTCAQFYRIESKVRYELFRTYCMSVYGSQLWDYSLKETELFYVAWRKSIRRMLCLPQRTHCSLLPLICQDLPIDCQLHKRFLNFVHSLIHSSNTCVWLCSQLAIRGSR